MIKKTAGFTLIEVLVVAAVSVLAGTLLIVIMVQNNGLFFHQTSKINQNLNLNETTNQLHEEIRTAVSVVTGYPTDTPVYLTSENILVVSLPSYNIAGNIIPNIYDYLVVKSDQSNAKLLKKYIFPDAQSSRVAEEKVLTTKLKSLTFQYLDSQGNTALTPSSSVRVVINITLEESSGVNINSNTTKIDISLRNK